MRRVVDTNVPIVANGRSDGSGEPAIECRIASITFLEELLQRGKILLDLAGEIQNEYHTYLNPRGEPGVGDRFYLTALQSGLERVERIELEILDSGEYADLPQPVIDAGFDPSDRKFAALAKKENVPVVNATDSDWAESIDVLNTNGINVIFLCGGDPDDWFADD